MSSPYFQSAFDYVRRHPDARQILETLRPIKSEMEYAQLQRATDLPPDRFKHLTTELLKHILIDRHFKPHGLVNLSVFRLSDRGDQVLEELT